jgi:hypothetical protein
VNNLLANSIACKYNIEKGVQNTIPKLLASPGNGGLAEIAKDSNFY